MSLFTSLKALVRVRPSRLASAPRLRVLSIRGRLGDTTMRLAVDGLVCGACGARTASALRSVPGVREARVDLDRGIAEVVTDHEVDERALRHAVAAVVVAPWARRWLERLVMRWQARGATARREGRA